MNCEWTCVVAAATRGATGKRSEAATQRIHEERKWRGGKTVNKRVHSWNKQQLDPLCHAASARLRGRGRFFFFWTFNFQRLKHPIINTADGVISSWSGRAALWRCCTMKRIFLLISVAARLYSPTLPLRRCFTLWQQISILQMAGLHYAQTQFSFQSSVRWLAIHGWGRYAEGKRCS